MRKISGDFPKLWFLFTAPVWNLTAQLPKANANCLISSYCPKHVCSCKYRYLLCPTYIKGTEPAENKYFYLFLRRQLTPCGLACFPLPSAEGWYNHTTSRVLHKNKESTPPSLSSDDNILCFSGSRIPVLQLDLGNGEPRSDGCWTEHCHHRRSWAHLEIKNHIRMDVALWCYKL